MVDEGGKVKKFNGPGKNTLLKKNIQKVDFLPRGYSFLALKMNLLLSQKGIR